MEYCKEKILFLFMLILMGGALLAQTTNVTISPKKLSIKEILQQLEQKAGISFMYSGLEKELAQQITLSPSAGTVNEIIRQIASQSGLELNRSGSLIAIKSSGSISGNIKGFVTDIYGQPLQGASVFLNNKTFITTDDAGVFYFSNISAGTHLLQISHINYSSVTEKIRVKQKKTAQVTIVLGLVEDRTMLNPVVVTGQYRPQSLNKSIYRVEVIDKKQIDNMAVSNVGELLKQQLNIEIENQSGMGRSKVRVLGLNSQYVKILMDNIPVAGDESMGSDVDLSTISLDDVERVEIVKGAMGVEYGANSIGGVINIITKKTARNKTDISLEIQEESVRNEYNLKYGGEGKGRHIQRIAVSHKLLSNLSAGGTFSRDKFNGYWGGREGGGLILSPVDPYNPPKRGYEWSPKESLNGNLYTSFTGKRIKLFYKFNYFISDLTNYGQTAYRFFLSDEQVTVNAGVNNDYRNTRFNHHLNIRGDFWKNAHYSLDISLQKNGLESRRQAINLLDNSVLNKANGIPGSERLQATDWEKYYQSKGIYAKGSLLKNIVKDRLDYNIGFELDNTTGNQGYTNWFNDVSLGNPIEQTLFTGAAYTSFEWQLSKRVMVRPGFRLNYSNKLQMRTNESVTTRFKINDNNDLRLIAGTSTRFPNYEELYSWYVNSVHDYRGNPDLLPEYGKSLELQWAHRKTLAENVQLETSVSSMFQHIRDRIVTITYFVEGEPQLTGRNTYTNENKYNGLLNQVNVNLSSEKFAIAIAGSILGYRGDDDASITAYRKFLTNMQATLQTTYVLPKGFRIALFYRFVGKQPLYTFVPKPVNGREQPTEFYKVLNETEAYHNADFNVAKSIWRKKVDLRIGVRNLFDITDIKYKPVVIPEGVPGYSGAGLRVMRLYYGRTYFVKLTYNIFSK